ncbi:Arginine ABC transporter, periplasmic arginine-binding protein ArtJ [Klebsiella pneumoniae IS53]|nr:Arginine ABC transporter, periplasmic arginine-binding protein ArtJ [Klebsiella pneumoniae IS53]
MEVTYPPFESYDSNNNIVGLDPEFAALIAQHLQAKPQLIDTKFTSLILGIGKKYDAVISGMYVTPERQKQADAIPYALSGASIIALKGGAVQPKTEDELCGVKVGLQAGTTWVTSLKKHSDEWCLKTANRPSPFRSSRRRRKPPRRCCRRTSAPSLRLPRRRRSLSTRAAAAWR